ncbi:Dna2/Cas4 domain-containing protein [Candidatus Marinimicrobia bacterium MT.SAG.2]|nr:Dna2/Cas4 domain-containing protein [Candidatus Marinimicrobia bacterium MT.SAG.2]
MADFKNKFSWSISQDRTFQTCKRKYYLNRYGSWGGWDKNSDELTRKIYILKNQATIPMLVGDVVHQTISKILDSLKARKTWDIGYSQKHAVRLFKDGWKQSKNEEWVQDPKRKKNLFEHYYDSTPSEEDLVEVGDSIKNTVENFYSSESFKFIKTSRPVDWLSKEELGEFKVAGETVYCKIDFAVKHEDLVYLYDWKTGKKISEDERQLAVYSLYAVNKWAVDLGSIRLFDVYLKTNTPLTIRASQKLVEETQQYIEKSIKEMKSLLDHPDENIASIDKFPMIENKNICKHCSFKEICYPDNFKEL